MNAGAGSGTVDDTPAGHASAAAASRATGMAAAPTGVVAFVGRCLKGQVGEPTPIASFVEYQQVFGGLWEESPLSHAVQQFFEHGGREALVVRVASGGHPPTLDLPAGDDTLVLAGICPGTHEFLRASVDYDGISVQDADLFNLVVQRVRAPGSELVEVQETFRRVSVLAGSAREIGRVLSSSQLVRLSGRLPRHRPDVTRATHPQALVGYVSCNRDGDDGEVLSDYDLIGSQVTHTGLFALEKGPTFNFLYVPPPQPQRDLGPSTLLVAARLCRRQHALLLVDPPLQWRGVDDAVAGMRAWPLRGRDVLMFFPRILSQDRLSGETREFAPSAAAIAVVLRDGQDAVAPWQTTTMGLLRPPAQPAVQVDEAGRARLARAGLNVIGATRTSGAGAPALRVLSAEQASPPQEWMLSERRLALLVAGSIERGTRWVATEGNTLRTRERVCRQVERFLSGLAAAGAFAGTGINRHYFVFCDERVNDVAHELAGELRLAYGFQSRFCSHRQSWLVVHRAAGSQTRPASVNLLAARELAGP